MIDAGGNLRATTTTEGTVYGADGRMVAYVRDDGTVITFSLRQHGRSAGEVKMPRKVTWATSLPAGRRCVC